jgi:hypothetical protein
VACAISFQGDEPGRTVCLYKSRSKHEVPKELKREVPIFDSLIVLKTENIERRRSA